MNGTAYLDTFANDNLPPREQWPELLFELDELAYPERLNCAVELLDRMVEAGHGASIAIRGASLTWTYAELLETVDRVAGERAVAWSGGSEPGREVNPSAIAAMAEIGIDITNEFPKPWTDEIVRASDVVVTMGCGDACPLFPGKRYEDWELDDPAGQGVDAVRPIRDEIRSRVTALLGSLGLDVAR